jgi:hypothetical protein
MTSIQKFTVGQVLRVFVEMLKTTRHIFSLIMITIEIFTVDQTLCVFVYMIQILQQYSTSQ